MEDTRYCAHCGRRLDDWVRRRGWRFCCRECREQHAHDGASWIDERGQIVLGDDD